MSEIPLIYKVMAEVLKDIKAIGKDKKNESQGFQYRGIDQVYNSLQPILAKHGIFSTPKVLNSEREERTNKNGTVLFYSRVTMQYTFWTIDGSSVECSVIGEGMDSGDKATNKAMAIAHKYALFQTFCIPVKDMEDPDNKTHELKPKTPSKMTGEEAAAAKIEFEKICENVLSGTGKTATDFLEYGGAIEPKAKMTAMMKWLRTEPSILTEQLQNYKYYLAGE